MGYGDLKAHPLWHTSFHRTSLLVLPKHFHQLVDQAFRYMSLYSHSNCHIGLFNLSNWLIFEDNCHFYITFCCISSPTSHRQIYVCLMYGGRLYCKLYLSNFRKWITHLEPRVKGSKSIPFTFIRVLKVQGFIVLFDNTCFKNM